MTKNTKKILLITTFCILLFAITFVGLFSYFKSTSKPASEEIKNNNQQEVIEKKIETQENEQKNEDKTEKNLEEPETNSVNPETSNNNSISDNEKNNEFKTFTGEEFKNFGDNFQFSEVTLTTQKPFIRGDEGADSRIQEMAEKRGYKLRPEADCKCLQPLANEAYNQMKSAMSSEVGLNLVLVSGFRSISDQRGIFLNQIASYSNQIIAEGRADQTINQILVTRSIPGYSKHHTGYTLDFGCNSSDLLNFKNSACYRWLSENNYYNAKRFGFIPSYPTGAVLQGPDPEEWEYVWVGVENLKE
jgi:LAS superfamily LD-carboxypeptidase LdcB